MDDYSNFQTDSPRCSRYSEDGSDFCGASPRCSRYSETGSDFCGASPRCSRYSDDSSRCSRYSDDDEPTKFRYTVDATESDPRFAPQFRRSPLRKPVSGLNDATSDAATDPGVAVSGLNDATSDAATDSGVAIAGLNDATSDAATDPTRSNNVSVDAATVPTKSSNASANADPLNSNAAAISAGVAISTATVAATTKSTGSEEDMGVKSQTPLASRGEKALHHHADRFPAKTKTNARYSMFRTANDRSFYSGFAPDDSPDSAEIGTVACGESAANQLILAWFSASVHELEPVTPACPSPKKRRIQRKVESQSREASTRPFLSWSPLAWVFHPATAAVMALCSITTAFCVQPSQEPKGFLARGRAAAVARLPLLQRMLGPSVASPDLSAHSDFGVVPARAPSAHAKCRAPPSRRPAPEAGGETATPAPPSDWARGVPLPPSCPPPSYLCQGRVHENVQVPRCPFSGAVAATSDVVQGDAPRLLLRKLEGFETSLKDASNPKIQPSEIPKSQDASGSDAGQWPIRLTKQRAWLAERVLELRQLELLVGKDGSGSTTGDRSRETQKTLETARQLIDNAGEVLERFHEERVHRVPVSSSVQPLAERREKIWKESRAKVEDCSEFQHYTRLTVLLRDEEPVYPNFHAGLCSGPGKKPAELSSGRCPLQKARQEIPEMSETDMQEIRAHRLFGYRARTWTHPDFSRCGLERCLGALEANCAFDLVPKLQGRYRVGEYLFRNISEAPFIVAMHPGSLGAAMFKRHARGYCCIEDWETGMRTCAEARFLLHKGLITFEEFVWVGVSAEQDGNVSSLYRAWKEGERLNKGAPTQGAGGGELKITLWPRLGDVINDTRATIDELWDGAPDSGGRSPVVWPVGCTCQVKARAFHNFGNGKCLWCKGVLDENHVLPYVPTGQLWTDALTKVTDSRSSGVHRYEKVTVRIVGSALHTAKRECRFNRSGETKSAEYVRSLRELAEHPNKSPLRKLLPRGGELRVKDETIQETGPGFPQQRRPSDHGTSTGSAAETRPMQVERAEQADLDVLRLSGVDPEFDCDHLVLASDHSGFAQLIMVFRGDDGRGGQGGESGNRTKTIVAIPVFGANPLEIIREEARQAHCMMEASATGRSPGF